MNAHIWNYSWFKVLSMQLWLLQFYDYCNHDYWFGNAIMTIGFWAFSSKVPAAPSEPSSPANTVVFNWFTFYRLNTLFWCIKNGMLSYFGLKLMLQNIVPPYCLNWRTDVWPINPILILVAEAEMEGVRKYGKIKTLFPSGEREEKKSQKNTLIWLILGWISPGPSYYALVWIFL